MSNTSSNTALFQSLHQQYEAMVQQLCLGFMKGDKEQAKDIAQEVFVNVWNAMDQFKGEASYKTWIYRITVNTCLLQIRSDKTKSAISLPSELSETPPNESFENGEAKYDALYKAIGQLPVLERFIIMMVLEELEYDEIAAIVGINSINLRVKIHRIKKKMKQLLNQEMNNE
jgi:RNA polymerase sigma-70 factor (ECF subfamily)